MNEFVAPGPGTWVLETAHLTGALPRYGQKVFPEGLARGFSEGMLKYGLPMKTLKMIPVNEFAYARQVMVAEPDDPGKGLPPAWLLYLITRLHPAFRERRRNAASALKNRQWDLDLAEWDNFYRQDSINRNLALVEMDLAAMDDEALIVHLANCLDNMLEMFYRHHKWSVSAMYPTGLFVYHATQTGKVSGEEAIALLKGSTNISKGAFREQLADLKDALTDAGVSLQDLQHVAAEDFVEHVRQVNDKVATAFDAYYKHVRFMLVSGYVVSEKTVEETPNIVKTRVLDALKGTAEATGIPADTAAKEQEIRSRLSAEELVDFDEWLSNARTCNRLRDERGIYNDIWGVGITRQGILEAARRLMKRGVIDDLELVVEEYLVW